MSGAGLPAAALPVFGEMPAPAARVLPAGGCRCAHKSKLTSGNLTKVIILTIVFISQVKYLSLKFVKNQLCCYFQYLYLYGCKRALL